MQVKVLSKNLILLIVSISLFSCAYDELGNGEEIKTAINVSTFSANDYWRDKN